MIAVPREPVEVWLRGNLRIAAVLALAAKLFVALSVASSCAAIGTAGAAAWWIVAGFVGVAAAAMAMLAWASARPRLLRKGDGLVIQVSPLARQEVPLEIVECFFPGSTPVDAAGAPTGDEHAAFRVGTLVVRLAERAVEYRSRDTFRPWVTWDDGSIVLDGRWCERLTPARARELGEKLMVAKRNLRDAAVACGTADGGPR